MMSWENPLKSQLLIFRYVAYHDHRKIATIKIKHLHRQVRQTRWFTLYSEAAIKTSL